MKRLTVILKSLVVAAGFIFAVPGVSLAAPSTTGATHINGFVTNNGAGVFQANVTVTCNGHTQTTGTTPSGYYIVFYQTADCPDGSTVSVVARKGSLVGGNTTTTTNHAASRDISLGTTSAALPEMNTFTAAIATVAVAGAFFVVRRRHFEKK